MITDANQTRRQFFRQGLVASGVLALTGSLTSAQTNEKPPADWNPEVPPTEDLMREHGVLRRCLLIFEESIRRINRKEEFPQGVLAETNDIVRQFIQEYHERLEEQYIFPVFDNMGEYGILVNTLRQQHQAARKLTGRIAQLTGAAVFKMPDNRREVVTRMDEFICVYRPHAAREDTVLFPAVRRNFRHEYFVKLGRLFEEREEKLFGDEGFEKMVVRVANLEKAVGLLDLARFTPRVT